MTSPTLHLLEEKLKAKREHDLLNDAKMRDDRPGTRAETDLLPKTHFSA